MDKEYSARFLSNKYILNEGDEIKQHRKHSVIKNAETPNKGRAMKETRAKETYYYSHKM